MKDYLSFDHGLKGENQKDVQESPLLSVCVQTYQHAPYIRECLDGILMQETSFPFEVIVGEDESSDGTREICQEFAERYPDQIRLFLRKREDVIFIKGKPTGRFNFTENLKNARGKYIAICEGDDYWCDPEKLEKQVDFLENNKEYIISFHDCFIVGKDGGVIQNSKLGKKRRRSLSSTEVAVGPLIPTLSAVFRNHPIVQNPPRSFFRIFNADTFLFAILGQFGDAYYHSDIEKAAYRQHQGGMWTGIDQQRKIETNVHTKQNLLRVISNKESRKTLKFSISIQNRRLSLMGFVNNNYVFFMRHYFLTFYYSVLNRRLHQFYWLNKSLVKVLLKKRDVEG